MALKDKITKDLNEVEIQLSLSYKEVCNTKKNTIVLYGGRVGGKTKQVSLMSALIMLGHPYSDGVVARASYGSLRDSSYAEMVEAITSIEGLGEEFEFKKSPLRIERIGGANTIYFMGYGGNNFSRTKGLKTANKIKFVIFEETQELKDERSLDEAMASFRRNFGEDVKVYLLGNPPPAKAHWFNMFVEKMKKDKDVLVKQMTWLDIIPFLNDYDLKEILKTKRNNPDYYNWFYMGETTGGFGSVYPMFRPEKHVISPQEFNIIRQTLKLACVVIGGDGAVNRDATSFVPLFIFANGQCCVGDIFYHNPQENNVIGSHTLVQDHVRRWFDDLCKAYNLGTTYDMLNNPYGANNITPIYMRIDSASTDLIQECRFFFGQRCDVGAISKATIMEMVSSVQSAISNEMVYIVDTHKYYNYVQNKDVKTDMNLLAQQLSLLIWNEKQTGYDSIVPNDVCDAFTYAIRFWYHNVENIQYFNILKANNMKLPFIKEILKGD